MQKLYDRDFYRWAKETAAALRSGRVTEIDLEDVAEEIEGLANRDFRELGRRLSRILEHKLKLLVVKGILLDQNRRGWMNTVRTQQAEVQRLLKSSPSLRPHVPELISEIYCGAVRTVADTYELPTPPECPWSVEEILG
jgi:hypothetical protein